MTEISGQGGFGSPPPRDRAAVARIAREAVTAVALGRAPAGVSVVIEGAPGIGKTFLARDILDAVAVGAAKFLRMNGDRRRRNEPFGGAYQLLGADPDGRDPGDAALDMVDELCADGPAVVSADDAHYLDAASLTLLRRLVWASRSLPLAVLVSTRPFPYREQLTMLVGQAQLRLRLPPMDRMMVERLVFDQTGRWPGPRLRRVLDAAAGNPLLVGELLRAYRIAGALADVGADSVEAGFELDLRATGLHEVIGSQLGQLDEPAREVLAAMAVWGTDVSVGTLADLLDRPASTLDEPLGHAIASGLVRRDPSGLVGFDRELFREVAYDEIPDPRRRAVHRRAARLLTVAGYRPALVAEHLLLAAGTASDPAVVAALQDAVAATSPHAPEMTADLLEEVAAISDAELPDPLLLRRAEALFLAGRGESAETLIRERIATIADPAIAAQLQLTLIRSLANRAETEAALGAIDRTTAIAGLPDPVRRQLEAVRLWLLVLAGQPPPEAGRDALMAGFVAAGDRDAQASVLSSLACIAYLSGRPDRALELMRARAEVVDAGGFRTRSSALYLPAAFSLDASGPASARAALDRARRLSAEGKAGWVDPFLGFTAGGIAFSAGDWDDAVAELDTALERAEETNTGWISVPVGLRSYIDAHRGRTRQARARLESFRHRGLPLQYRHDNPGLAELAVLEAEGETREAATLAGTLWTAALGGPGRWTAILAADAARVALVGMDRRLAAQITGSLSAIGWPGTARLTHGMLTADPDEIDAAATEFAAAGRLTAEVFAREELACAAAAAGDRERAGVALEAALAGYQRMGAVPDRDRALARTRALGLRRASRDAHRSASFGWESLTATELRIAALVRDGLTNREIGTRLYVSPRTAQAHISHILQKTGLRSRVEIARAAETEIRRPPDASPGALPDASPGVSPVTG